MQYFGFDRPSFAFKTYGFGANPDAAILALFAGGKQGVWYDPSDKSTLFQDVAGTIPVTKAGDPIGLMKDKSGNGYHATQTLSAARPIYKTDGVLHWFETDGMDDWFQTNYTPSSDWSSVISLALRSGGGFIFESNVTAANNYADATSKGVYVLGAPSGFANSSALTYNKAFIKTSNVVGDNIGTRPISIGGRSINGATATFTTNMLMYGFFLRDEVLDVQSQALLEQYLAKKSGVTL